MHPLQRAGADQQQTFGQQLVGLRTATIHSRDGRPAQEHNLNVKVQLAQTAISASQLVGLRVGDIITTEKDIHSPLIVAVEGVPKFRARPGQYKGRKAVLIESVIENPVDALGE